MASMAARAEARFDWRGAMARGAVILVLQVAMACLTIFGIADRQASAGELAANAAVSVALLGFAGVVGRWVGDLRRPYDGWLRLKIAE